MLGWADDVARVNSYDVKINAPKQVDDLLESYLDVYRWRKQKKDLAVDDLQAAVDRTPQDAANLLNTEGYFSPVVKATLNHDGEHYRVDVTVDPGPVATVRKIDFRLTGTVNDDPPYRDNLLQRLKSDPALTEGSVFTQRNGTPTSAARLPRCRTGVTPQPISARARRWSIPKPMWLI